MAASIRAVQGGVVVTRAWTTAQVLGLIGGIATVVFVLCVLPSLVM
jgi:hypothetical protein